MNKDKTELREFSNYNIQTNYDLALAELTVAPLGYVISAYTLLKHRVQQSCLGINHEMY